METADIPHEIDPLDLVVRMALWNNLPELHDKIRQHEQEELERVDYYEGHIFHIGVYSYITDCFDFPFFTPLMTSEHPDEDAMRRSAAALEQMLSEDDEHHSINDAIAIRVMQYLLLDADRWRTLRPFAGPLLTAMAREEAQYHWFEDEPVVPD